MLTRTALALLLLLPSAASAQELDTAVSAVVRISGMRDGTPVRGSGFVVGLDRDKATIVTASHVIEGLQQIEVTFAVNTTEHFSVDGVLGMDTGSPNGLAAFQVRGALPAGVTTLSFETESRPSYGAELFLVGFPQMELAPRTPRRALSGRRGALLLVDQGIGEGFSGGPVLQGGKVVGVVTDTDEQTTYAVNAVVARESLEGWGVKLGGQNSTSVARTVPEAKPPAPTVEKCVPGEIQTENGIDFVRICPGTFRMGSTESDKIAEADEKPDHRVTLSEFWISKTEITNAQYRRFRSDHEGDDDLPVANINWEDAKAACESFGGRLPTEAEWEYAARAGSQTSWSFGYDEKMLDKYAWYSENSGRKPHPVGTRKANTWGLHDLYGNVWEWVADWYGPYSFEAQKDPAGPAGLKRSQSRVLRGGSFLISSPRSFRSANRVGFLSSIKYNDVGFRCARPPHQP
jgi:formylglycine-generating enzyme required for sulfatase activity